MKPYGVHGTILLNLKQTSDFPKPDGVITTLRFEVDGVHRALRLHVIRIAQRDVLVDVDAWCRMHAIWFSLRNVARTG